MSEPYWMTIARAELRHGVYEIPGPESEKRIELYQSFCDWKHSNDAIAWCSSFACFCVEGGDSTYQLLKGRQRFVQSTRSARARSWLEWGVEISHPPIGAIVVMKRGPEPQPDKTVTDAKGHVCLFDGWANPDEFVGVGGNQSNQVRASLYKIDSVLAFKWAA